MTKRKANAAITTTAATMPDLPPLDPAEPDDVHRESIGATVWVPISKPVDGGYRSNHVDVQLTSRQADALHHVLAGLDAAGARLDDGRRVFHKVDVVRWILEKVADELK